MNELKVFKNEEFGQVRTINKDNDVWFVGKDVAEALGYSNASKAVIMHVDDEDKAFTMIDIADSQNGNLPSGQTKVTIINESGLYSLVLSSKLPTAKKFKRWVTAEVLPTIRKTGGYLTPEKVEEVLSNPDTIIKLATDLKNERAKRQEAEALLQVAKPKVVFADSVANSENTILIGELAKLIKQNGYDIGQKRLFAWMRENGYLIKQQGGSYNMPTQKAMQLELFKIKESSIIQPDGAVRLTRTVKVTGKGQQYFINKFLGEQAQQSFDLEVL